MVLRTEGEISSESVVLPLALHATRLGDTASKPEEPAQEDGRQGIGSAAAGRVDQSMLPQGATLSRGSDGTSLGD
jgi:hypothetical protein